MKLRYIVLVIAVNFLQLCLPCKLTALEKVGAEGPYNIDTPGTLQSSSAKRDSISIYFRQDDYKIDENYRGNNHKINTLRSILQGRNQIDSIIIYSSASPEGVYERNIKLSNRRAESLQKLISSTSPSSSLTMITHSLGEDWEGLYREIEANYHRADREQVLKILSTNAHRDAKKWQLSRIDSGRTWNYIIKHHAYQQRQSSTITVYYHTRNWAQQIADELAIKYNSSDSLTYKGYSDVHNSIARSHQAINNIALQNYMLQSSSTIHINPYEKAQRFTIFALKTNLLFDAAAAVNFSVEVPIGNRISVLYQHNFPWYLTRNNQYCFQVLSFGGEIRYWLGGGRQYTPRFPGDSQFRLARRRFRKSDRDYRLQGHFVGLYAFNGSSDIQLRDKICYQTRFNSIGLTYGYSTPIGENLQLEFVLGLGYAYIPYQHYTPSEDWKLLFRDYSDAGILNYFGPTKLEISLVVPIKATVGGTEK